MSEQKKPVQNDTMMSVYDLVRLRHAVRLSTQSIIEKNFVRFYLGPSSGLPVLTLNSKLTPKKAIKILEKNRAELWQYQQGTAKSSVIINLLVLSGFFASTKSNKKGKPKPRFKTDSPALMFIGNLLYNFDSFNYFSNDKRVVQTIDGNPTHEDNMYVLGKVINLVKRFIKLFKDKKITKENTDDFINQIVKEGGE